MEDKIWNLLQQLKDYYYEIDNCEECVLLYECNFAGDEYNCILNTARAYCDIKDNFDEE